VGKRGCLKESIDGYVWWKELVQIRNGEGSWFEENLRRVMGDTFVLILGWGYSSQGKV